MGCLIFWLGRCDAPDHCVELSAISGADAFAFGLSDERLQVARSECGS